ncbi:lymphocyte cytosolic protein 2 [Pelodytes ibericus]
MMKRQEEMASHLGVIFVECEARAENRSQVLRYKYTKLEMQHAFFQCTASPMCLSQYPWYTGSISRQEAEDALKSMNQNGTFLVRDSSQSSSSQPFVLMVLYREKVYNVRIRYRQHENVYLLGSGGQEIFSSVPEIIDYFRKTPLLLIDGKDRGSRNHCKLTFTVDRNLG